MVKAGRAGIAVAGLTGLGLGARHLYRKLKRDFTKYKSGRIRISGRSK